MGLVFPVALTDVREEAPNQCHHFVTEVKGLYGGKSELEMSVVKFKT